MDYFQREASRNIYNMYPEYDYAANDQPFLDGDVGRGYSAGGYSAGRRSRRPSSGSKRMGPARRRLMKGSGRSIYSQFVAEFIPTYLEKHPELVDNPYRARIAMQQAGKEWRRVRDTRPNASAHRWKKYEDSLANANYPLNYDFPSGVSIITKRGKARKALGRIATYKAQASYKPRPRKPTLARALSRVEAAESKMIKKSALARALSRVEAAADAKRMNKSALARALSRVEAGESKMIKKSALARALSRVEAAAAAKRATGRGFY